MKAMFRVAAGISKAAGTTPERIAGDAFFRSALAEKIFVSNADPML